MWQSPEAVLSALHSETDTVRLDAFHLLGVEGDDAWEWLHGKNGDSKVIAAPRDSLLRYAALGETATKQAVLAVQVQTLILMAVAIPQNGKWIRIAGFKFPWYRATDGGDPLGSAVTLARFPGLYYEVQDLVLRVSELPGSDGTHALRRIRSA